MSVPRWPGLSLAILFLDGGPDDHPVITLENRVPYFPDVYRFRLVTATADHVGDELTDLAVCPSVVPKGIRILVMIGTFHI